MIWRARVAESSLVLIAVVAAVGCEDGGMSSSSNEAANTDDAVRAAESWLALVDRALYDESWDQACTAFRSLVPKPQWVAQIRGVRGPLGAVQNRSLQNATFTTELPGSPDGEYVVVQYQTRFERKASATETITPMRDTDGSWRVSGYYIR